MEMPPSRPSLWAGLAAQVG